MEETKKCLHMFSGGRDSLLAACLMIEKGFNLEIISYNNGHIGELERSLETANILKNTYPNYINILPITNVAMTMNEFGKIGWYMTTKELNKYPSLQMYQLNCMFCKIAMFIHSIAYCKAKGIQYISDGTRKCQGFFVDEKEFQMKLERLFKDNDLTLISPIYNEESDSRRKYMLCDRNLPTKTLEPQCYLGCPLLKKLSFDEKKDLSNFFDDYIFEKIQCYIDELVEVKKFSV